MRLDQYTEAVRTCATSHLFEIAQIFEPRLSACGEPLDFKISAAQTAEAMRAIETLRRITFETDLVPNTARTEGRHRQGASRGRPASEAARANLY